MRARVKDMAVKPKSIVPEVGEPGDYETSAIGRHLGYVRRTEAHGISAYDWMWMMDFANAAWGGR